MRLSGGRWLAVALAAVGLATAAVPTLTHATEVDVRVLGVNRSGGVVRATVCGRDMFLQTKCHYGASAGAGAGGAVVVPIPDVPPGTYAVQVFHDIHMTGRVSQTLFGFPTEGVGFSRDAPIRFGPPRFSDAAIAVSGKLVTIDINLKFEP